MRFSPFDFDVVTTPDELPSHKPVNPLPDPEGTSDHATASDHGVPAAEKPK